MAKKKTGFITFKVHKVIDINEQKYVFKDMSGVIFVYDNVEQLEHKEGKGKAYRKISFIEH